MSLKTTLITTALAAAACGPALAAPVPLTIAYQTSAYTFPVGNGQLSINNIQQTVSGNPATLTGAGNLPNSVGTPILAFAYSGVGLTNITATTALVNIPNFGPISVPVTVGTLTGGTFIIGDPSAPFLTLALNTANASKNLANSIGTAVNGGGILDVTGGTAANYFNTNSFSGGDLEYSVTFTNCSFASVSCNGGGSISFKTQQVSIPEPGSLALGAVGLLAFGAWRRRRAESNS